MPGPPTSRQPTFRCRRPLAPKNRPAHAPQAQLSARQRRSSHPFKVRAVGSSPVVRSIHSARGRWSKASQTTSPSSIRWWRSRPPMCGLWAATESPIRSPSSNTSTATKWTLQSGPVHTVNTALLAINCGRRRCVDRGRGRQHHFDRTLEREQLGRRVESQRILRGRTDQRASTLAHRHLGHRERRQRLPAQPWPSTGTDRSGSCPPPPTPARVVRSAPSRG